MKRHGVFVFAIFSYLYLSTASILAVPYSTVFRWIGSVLLVANVFFHTQTLKLSIPRPYLFLFIALIPTILGLCTTEVTYAYGRIISLLLVLFSMMMFFQHLPVADLPFLFEIYAFLSGCMCICSLLTGRIVNNRLVGIYGNANFLSSIAVFTVVGSIGLFQMLKGKIRRWFYIPFIACAIICILRSASRTGFLCIVFAVFISPILFSEKRTWWQLVKPLLALTVISIGSLYILNRYEIIALDRLLLTSDSGANAIFSRGEVWRDVISIFLEHPIWGWGYSAVSYNVFISPDLEYIWGMHSSYFVILCEMGIIGTILFLIFFMDYFRFVYLGYKRLDTEDLNGRLFLKTCALCIAVMLLNAYSEAFLFSFGNPMSICFWMPLLMAFAYGQNSHKKI